MNVQQLINHLKKQPPDAEVVVQSESCYPDETIAVTLKVIDTKVIDYQNGYTEVELILK